MGEKPCAYTDASHTLAKLPAVSMYANEMMYWSLQHSLRGGGGGLLFGSKWPYSRISTDTAGRKTCKFANSPIQSLSIREHPELPKPYSYLKPVWCIISPLECRWGYSVGNSACLRYVYHLAALCHGDKEAYSLISYRGRTEAQLFDMTSQGPT